MNLNMGYGVKTQISGIKPLDLQSASTLKWEVILNMLTIPNLAQHALP